MLNSLNHLPSTLVMLLSIATSFSTANGRVIQSRHSKSLPRSEDIPTFASFEDLVAHHGAIIVDTASTEIFINSTDIGNATNANIHDLVKRADALDTIGNLHEYTWNWVTKTCTAVAVSTATLALSSYFLLITVRNIRSIAAIMTGDGRNPATLPKNVKRDLENSNITYARIDTEIEFDQGLSKRTTHPIKLLYSIDHDNGLIELDQANIHLGTISGQESDSDSGSNEGNNNLKKRFDESHEIGVGFSGPVIHFQGDENYYRSTQEYQISKIFNYGNEACKQEYICGPQGCMGMAIQASSYYGFNVRNLWGECYGASRDWIN
ncbi:uncharacterized protein I206_103523 [Kwoniella pini CBS 10737]|uniref:Uncharacterized protein n=1 Tax=Kwoniella pini CBS 10737 TaxID=1296096 RepID=A0A1B9I9A7_9TREE|nr:uncharacterized protein I206_01473 [Kwoniella pini CBS 10737]OCF52188.1 hypothetical protein I206_01473 [Kwoniella pini CBS 10737]